MRFSGICVLVEDMNRAKKFYTEVLGQKIMMDMVQNVTFEGGYALQSAYEELMGIPKKSVTHRSHSFELYFETEEDLNQILDRLEKANVEFLHKIREAPWAQYTIAFYDPDGHLVEVGETMPSLVKRLQASGMDVAAVAQRTGLPQEAVTAMLNAPESETR